MLQASRQKSKLMKKKSTLMKTAAAAVLIAASLGWNHCRAEQPDIVLADFEGSDYGNWTVDGTAFGSGPAHGALQYQMKVEGFQGRGFANSYHGGDNAKGMLTSPEFKIERRYIKFLIGGGGFEGKTCMNLLIDGSAVRTATGPNIVPGGSERLDPASWDVSEFAGKMARIQIVDNATGGWGHINVDQIVQTDIKPATFVKNVFREIPITQALLHFPVKTGAPKRQVQVFVDGKLERFFEIELADKQPEWWAPLDVSQWKGKTARVVVDKLPDDSEALRLVEQGEKLKNSDDLYREPLRAQLHFSPKRGWNNDPNGMVYTDGEYHLFFQLNPYGWNWGNMHWGHAVSPDMVHWKELPIAIYPHVPGDWVFSGGAAVDDANTSGWKSGTGSLIVAAFTSTGRGQCVVYSNDRGRTFREFEGNPVITNATGANRDPRPFWYAPGKHWVIAVYDEFDKRKNIAFHTSPDLKSWTFQSRIEGFYECPDIFELPVGGKKRWVLTSANSDYMVGQFDGKKFTPETAKLKGNFGSGFYAAQTFSNEPRGRVVQIGWFQTATPGMPFNQSMSLPMELGLRATAEGPRMTRTPVKELESLRVKAHRRGMLTLNPGDENPMAAARGELLEVRATFSAEPKAQAAFKVRGVPIVYSAEKGELTVNYRKMAAPEIDGCQKLVIYADRTSIEVLAGDGLIYFPLPIEPRADNKTVEVAAVDGSVVFASLEVYELKSAWQ